MSGTVEIAPPFTATERQSELARVANDPAARVILAGGAIRSGKTQAAGRLIVEMAVERPSVYLVARSTYRSLKDTTQKALLHGDGALPPLIPPEFIKQYRASDEIVLLQNGSEILFRSLEEGQVGKLLNLTLGGILVDQIEELDGGADGERIFDTLLGRLSDPRGPRKLIAVANPSGLTHWVYRRLACGETRDKNARYVHFVLRDNVQNLPPDYVDDLEATRETRSHWYRANVLGEWGSFEGQAFEEFDEAIHVVPPFALPDHWIRAESLDHGTANPTAHYIWATDEDGNSIAVSEYHEPALVSSHAEAIRARRERWYPTSPDYSQSPVLWADPSIFAHHGHTGRELGEPLSIADEYNYFGIRVKRANHDRAAGFARMLELLHLDTESERPFPRWHPRYGETGAPRLYFFSTCKNAIAQMKSAPVAADGLDAGECYDRKWANEHGHAVDAIRYFCITRPSPSKEPPRPLDDPRAEYMRSWRNRRAKTYQRDPSGLDRLSESLVDF